MNLFQAVVLGVVQGITEFLPISSSGHLVLFQKLFSISNPPIFFDVMAHLGTLIAVILYFGKYLVKISRKTLVLVVVGSIPVVLTGLLLKDRIEEIFNSLTLLAFSFILTSLILFSTRFFKEEKTEMSWKDALFVGLFQAAAILPGVSRAGSTISAGIFRKLDRETAFRFSFLLFIPAILGALTLQLFDLDGITRSEMTNSAIGFFAALVFGLLSLKLLEKVLLKGKFSFFSLYCFILGILILVLG